MNTSPNFDGSLKMKWTSCCAFLTGTTSKHVVMLAGNTAKHGLRCKACKMSIHHKCEKGVGSQRCQGKLVRASTSSQN